MSELIKFNILKRVKSKSKNLRCQIDIQERDDNKAIYIKISTKRLESKEKRIIAKMEQFITLHTFFTLMKMSNFAFEDKNLHLKIDEFMSNYNQGGTSIWGVEFADKNKLNE